MENIFSVVTTTTSTNEDAEIIAKILLELNLAACIQITTIKSYYTWKGEMAIEDEYLLIVKIKHNDYPEVEKCIKNNHKYEVPEILELPITDGSPEYLTWMKEVTK